MIESRTFWHWFCKDCLAEGPYYEQYWDSSIKAGLAVQERNCYGSAEAARKAAIHDTLDSMVEHGDDETPLDEIEARLRVARKIVAEQRRRNNPAPKTS